MTVKKRLWLLAITAALAAPAPGAASAQRAAAPAAGGDVRAGIDAWTAQNYAEAVQIWRPLGTRAGTAGQCRFQEGKKSQRWDQRLGKRSG